jgi:hypothetical protein
MAPRIGWARSAAAAVGLTMVLAACGGNAIPDDAGGGPATESGAESDGGSATASDAVELPQIASSPREDVPSALQDMAHEAFPEPLIDPAEILSGGPPPDGIPAIDTPKFERVADVDWLADDEAVLAIEIDGDARAYPYQILTWHEIVNDTVGDVPVAVTYCPLCNSGVGFDRRVDDKVLDFGTSGRLYASNLVMYDRQTESLWPQLTGEAAVGTMTGTRLEFVPVFPIGWSDFRDDHPDGWVLSRDTGHSRDYGRNPYVGYDVNPEQEPMFGAPTDDDRLFPLDRVIALESSGEQVAVLRSVVEEAGVLTESVGDQQVVLLFVAGQNSALEAAAVAEGRDIGTVAVFDPRLDGGQLTFTARDDGRFVDEQTGSTWTIRGRAVGGPLEGEQLDGYPFIDTFWKSWVAFAPDTRLVEEHL